LKPTERPLWGENKLQEGVRGDDYYPGTNNCTLGQELGNVYISTYKVWTSSCHCGETGDMQRNISRPKLGNKRRLDLWSVRTRGGESVHGDMEFMSLIP
jgi:hypothetical protein